MYKTNKLTFIFLFIVFISREDSSNENEYTNQNNHYQGENESESENNKNKSENVNESESENNKNESENVNEGEEANNNKSEDANEGEGEGEGEDANKSKKVNKNGSSIKRHILKKYRLQNKELKELLHQANSKNEKIEEYFLSQFEKQEHLISSLQKEIQQFKMQVYNLENTKNISGFQTKKASELERKLKENLAYLKEKLQNEIESKSAIIEELKDQLRDQQNQNESVVYENKNLQELISRMSSQNEKQVESYMDSTRKLEEKIELYKLKITELENKFEQIKTAYNNVKNTLDRSDCEVTELRTDKMNIKQKLEKVLKQNQILREQAESADISNSSTSGLKKRIQELETTLVEKNQKITNANENISENQNKITVLLSTLKELQHELNRKELDLTRLNADNNNLRKQNNKLSDKILEKETKNIANEIKKVQEEEERLKQEEEEEEERFKQEIKEEEEEERFKQEIKEQEELKQKIKKEKELDEIDNKENEGIYNREGQLVNINEETGLPEPLYIDSNGAPVYLVDEDQNPVLDENGNNVIPQYYDKNGYEINPFEKSEENKIEPQTEEEEEEENNMGAKEEIVKSSKGKVFKNVFTIGLVSLFAMCAVGAWIDNKNVGEYPGFTQGTLNLCKYLWSTCKGFFA